MRVSLIQITPGPAHGSLYAVDTEGRLWLYGPPETAKAHTLSGGIPGAVFSWQQIETPEEPGNAADYPGMGPTRDRKCSHLGQFPGDNCASCGEIVSEKTR